MKTEVFDYAWIYCDQQTLTPTTKVCDHKVTRNFFEDRKRTGGADTYTILEDTKELVESNTIVEGKYHPELRRQK